MERGGVGAGRRRPRLLSVSRCQIRLPAAASLSWTAIPAPHAAGSDPKQGRSVYCTRVSRVVTTAPLRDLGDKRRAGLAEHAPGVACRADRGDAVGPGARHHECAVSKLMSCARGTDSGSPVRIDSSRRRSTAVLNSPSATTWSPARTSTTSPKTTSDAGTLRAEHIGMGRDELRESFQRPLGADLLGNSDLRVRHQDPEKQGVSPNASVTAPKLSRIRLKTSGHWRR